MTKLIPTPTDAPPGTVPTLREMADRIYELERRQDFIVSDSMASNKGLSATVQGLSRNVEDLNSRYAVQANGDFNYNTGPLPADSTWRTFGSEMYVQIKSPGKQKQILVTVGAAEISIEANPPSALVAEVTWKWEGSGSYGSYFARIYLTGDQRLGIPVIATRSFRLDPGVYTITAVTRAWVATGSAATSSVNFTGPYVRAEVVGAEGTDN